MEGGAGGKEDERRLVGTEPSLLFCSASSLILQFYLFIKASTRLKKSHLSFILIQWRRPQARLRSGFCLLKAVFNHLFLLI